MQNELLQDDIHYIRYITIFCCSFKNRILMSAGKESMLEDIKTLKLQP